MVHALFQIDGAESRLGSLDSLPGRGAVVDQWQLHVVQRGRARQKIEGLENEADLAIPNAGQLVICLLYTSERQAAPS